MSDITNKFTLKRVIRRQSGVNTNKTNKVGIIFTGDFPELDENFVETEILRNFDISVIDVINTVGKKEKAFQYVDCFAQKYKLPVTSFCLETYSVEDLDLQIKRNANICYSSDSVIIFHGDTKNDIVAWNAYSAATRVKSDEGKSILINSTRRPCFVGCEKKVYELLQMRDKNAWFEDESSFMEESFFELMSGERIKFVKYIQQGVKLSFKKILRKLTEIYLEGRDLDYLDGYASISDKFIDSLIWYFQRNLFDKDGNPKKEEIEQYIKKEIHPEFFYRSSRKEEDVCYVMFYHFWYGFEYLMLHMIPSYENRGDEETCAALCFGQWIEFQRFKGIDNAAIYDKQTEVSL